MDKARQQPLPSRAHQLHDITMRRGCVPSCQCSMQCPCRRAFVPKPGLLYRPAAGQPNKPPPGCASRCSSETGCGCAKGCGGKL
ncbi:hypothetical protein ElyMa_001923400 [Elysia marginata]|uniref:Metallothionein n=1 Tax=Elysia marginata TaxID=1093978 RepID=A0AAV4EUN4_9GAST|nr:hypothetical protein ElyMa_001923400 [Elysia marginata]